MCGISVLLTPNSFDRLDDRINVCMARRGPDQIGVVKKADLIPGINMYGIHSRLSITGVNRALNQPIEDADKIMFFNGEIYNYIELNSRYDICDPGESDTNVLWGLINKIGILNAVEQLDGMYAIILYSKKERTFYITCDHFGQKPIYLYKVGGEIAFVSEPEYLFHFFNKFVMNENFVNKLLQVGYKFRNENNECEIRNLERLNPNKLHKFKITRNDVLREELDIEKNIIKSKPSTSESTFLCDNIKLTFPREVKLGLPLSSGVDSNFIYEVLKCSDCLEQLEGVYTVNGLDPRYSETQYLKPLIDDLNKFNINHHIVSAPTGIEFLNILRLMVRQRIGLVSGLNYVGQFKMYQLMNFNGVKVSLSGVGADELFSGYYDHYNLYYAGNPSESFRRLWHSNVEPFVRNPWLKNIELFVQRPSMRKHLLENSDEFSGLFKIPVTAPKFEEDQNLSLLRRRMKRELESEIVPVVLRDDDFNSMFHSVESRAPYLMEAIYEFSITLDDDRLFSDGIAKSPLRRFGLSLNPTNEAFKRYHKIGFNLSVYDLIGDQSQQVFELLGESKFVRDYLNIDILRKHIEQNNQSNYFSKMLFSLLNIAILEETIS